MSRLTIKTNGEWDFNNLEGQPKNGIVCHNCGEIVPLTYRQIGFGKRFGLVFYSYCPNCFRGDKKTALTCRIGFEV